MISVIIPVYNAEPYLAHCLDAVLGSTYPDFELLLINDGSTDRSLAICREYARRDSRVRLFSQENQGVSAARNRGLEECAGEWIVFVDADDVISPDFLSLVAAEDDAAQDMLLFDFAGTEPQLAHINGQTGDCLPARQRIYYAKEGMHCLFREVLRSRQLVENGNVNLASSNGRAFKKAIIDRYGIRFSPELTYGEDMVFTMEYQLKAMSCTYIPIPVYFYSIHGDSSSRRFVSVRSIRARWERMEKMRSVLEAGNLFSLLEDDYYSSVLQTMAFLLLRVIFSPCGSLAEEEKYELCREMHQSAVLRQAMRHNRGGPPDRWLVIFFFRLRWYPVLRIMGRYSYSRLKRNDPNEIEKMRESGWYR